MSIELKGALFAGLDKYLSRFLEIYRAETGLVELKNLLKSLDSDVSKLKSQLLLICPIIYKMYENTRFVLFAIYLFFLSD